MKNIPIVYENNEIIVFIKPYGTASQGGKSITYSIDNLLPSQLGFPVYLVHRLDKQTYGLMIAAKSPEAAAKWTKLISGKSVKKEYTAICLGKITPKNGIINDTVEQHGVKKNALTYYDTIKESIIFCEEELHLTMLRLRIETGRMHQIRIHLANKNCPIAADDKHGNFCLNKKIKKILGIKKMLLASIKLVIPENSGQKIIEIDIPDYMKIMH